MKKLFSILLILCLTACGQKDTKETIKSLHDYTLSLSQDTYTYDGTEKKPDVIVKKDDEEVELSDLEISYKNNVEPGTADVIINGFQDTVTLHFTITKKDNSNFSKKDFIDILNTVKDVQEGSAGSSLKLYVVALNYLEYASRHKLKDVDKTLLQETLSSWYESLDDKDLIYALNDINETGTDILNNFKENKDMLDDAGVLKDAQTLMKDKDMKENWTALSDVLTEFIRGLE